LGNFFEVRKKIIDFVKEDVIPNQSEYSKQMREAMMETQKTREPMPGEDPAYARHAVWARSQPPILYELRQKAKACGLYNFFLPEVGKLSVLEYAPIAEIFGAFPLANVAMNCSAPDTGNMEVIEKYGSPEQKKKWLEPLLEGHIRSAFAMTEPGVASSQHATELGLDGRRVGHTSTFEVHAHRCQQRDQGSNDGEPQGKHGTPNRDKWER